jgi:hypothetical protein
VLNPKLIKGPWVKNIFNSDYLIRCLSNEISFGTWPKKLELYCKKFAGEDWKAMQIKMAQSSESRHKKVEMDRLGRHGNYLSSQKVFKIII